MSFMDFTVQALGGASPGSLCASDPTRLSAPPREKVSARQSNNRRDTLIVSNTITATLTATNRHSRVRT